MAIRIASIGIGVAFAMTLAACGSGQMPDDGKAGTAAAVEVAPDGSTSVSADITDIYGPSGVYALDKGHAYIVFSYDHQGYSTPFLRWRDWDAELNWDSANPDASSVKAVIRAESIDSGVDDFDGHLKGDRFFDVANYPTIEFESQSVVKTGDTSAEIVGDLTIKGQTHPVTLQATFNAAAFDERGNANKLGFSAITQIRRSEWGLGFAVPAVSDEVDIRIEVEFEQPA